MGDRYDHEYWEVLEDGFNNHGFNDYQSLFYVLIDQSQIAMVFYIKILIVDFILEKMYQNEASNVGP